MNMENEVKRLIEAYNRVFDENGEIKLCGRYACMGLITSLENIQKRVEGLDFGNKETGMMNVENIKKAMGTE